MTNKVYRSAQGKMVDLGTIMLQNEQVRAVGNMKVNARGDRLDSLNQVIETRTERIQRQNDRTSNHVNSAPQTSSNRARAKKTRPEPESQIHSRGHSTNSDPDPVAVPEPVAPVQPPQAVAAPVARTVAPTPVAVAPIQTAKPQTQAPEVNLKNPARPPKSPANTTAPNSATQAAGGSGLAGAIARSREIKQELDRTRRQQAQDQGLRKI
jgi:hypothetical protein